MSADPDNEFFSDGITDDVIVALTAVKGLKVAARTSSFAFKNKNADLATVGKTLGVRTVLQGSVRRAGNRVRVTVQLMNASEGTQLWSERYDRELDDIFAIQDEIARGSSSSSGCVWASSTQAGSSCRVRPTTSRRTSSICGAARPLTCAPRRRCAGDRILPPGIGP